MHNGWFSIALPPVSHTTVMNDCRILNILCWFNHHHRKMNLYHLHLSHYYEYDHLLQQFCNEYMHCFANRKINCQACCCRTMRLSKQDASVFFRSYIKLMKNHCIFRSKNNINIIALWIALAFVRIEFNSEAKIWMETFLAWCIGPALKIGLMFHIELVRWISAMIHDRYKVISTCNSHIYGALQTGNCNENWNEIL